MMKPSTVVIAGLATLGVLCGILFLWTKPLMTMAAPAPRREATSRARAEPEEDSARRDLITKYSEARMNLAKHAAQTALEVKQSTLKVARSLSEIYRSNEGTENSAIRADAESPRAAFRRRFGDTHGELHLSPEQEEQTVALVLNLFDQQAQAFEEKVAMIESRREELERLILASDAYHRKELTEEEYRSLLAEADEQMREALMPPDHNRLGIKSSYLHREFQPRFLALLDEKQKEVFEQAPEGFYLDDEDNREMAAPDPPAMSLDSRDRQLTALKKVLGAISGMFED